MAHNTTPKPITVTFTTKQITRFWLLVDKQTNGCWEWRGSKVSNGYGTVFFSNRSYKAHRIAWLLCNGEIPDGMYICHTCDNPGCVRPDHLFPGTPQQNHDDMKNKGHAPVGERSGRRKHPERWDNRNMPKGENHPNAKLSEETVRDILRRFVRRGPYRTNAPEIAIDLGLSQALVLSIGNRVSWKHVTIDDGKAKSGV